MQINLTSTIYLLAALQAGLLIGVIARKPKVSFSEKYLMVALVALAITLIHYVGIINRLLSTRSLFMDISAISWLTISPLLYLYCRALVGKDRRWRWSFLVYFPFSLYLLAQMVLFSLGIYVGFFLLFDNMQHYTIYWIGGYLVNSLVFSLLSIRVLQKTQLSEKHRGRIDWLIWYFRAFSVTLVGLIGMLIWWLNAAIFVQEFEYYLLVFYSLLIFTLVVKSLRFSNYFNVLSNDHYGHDQKAQEVLAQLHRQLEEYMRTEKPFLNPKLTLANLSQATQIPENQLSQIFTRHLRTNFYRYINQFRLQEFENQLQTKGTEQYTIMALAEASGFASKATFYKIFKEAFDMTPTAYLKGHSKLDS